MVSQPRPQLYRFAHVVLRSLVHKDPVGCWSRLTGEGWSSVLAYAWTLSADEGESKRASGLRVEALQRRGDWELLPIGLPDPQAPTEAHYILLVRRASAPAAVGYFVMEAGIPNEKGRRAYVSEWRSDGSRLRMGDLPMIRLPAFVDYVAEELAGRGSIPFPVISEPSTTFAAPSPSAARWPTAWLAIAATVLVGALAIALLL